MVPSPLASTSLIISCRPASVGVWPSERITCAHNKVSIDNTRGRTRAPTHSAQLLSGDGAIAILVE